MPKTFSLIVAKCAMTLEQFKTWSSVVQSLSVAGASVGTFLLALYGVKNWLREFKGKRDTELCEDVLEKFYQAQEAIRWMRSPYVLSNEQEEEPKESSKPNSANQSVQVLFNRYNAKQELFSKIHALRFRFMARFGRDAGAPFEELNRALSELFSSARMLARVWARPGTEALPDPKWEEHVKQIEKLELIFWGTGDDRDAFDKNIDCIIKNLEATCHEWIAR